MEIISGLRPLEQVFRVYLVDDNQNFLTAAANFLNRQQNLELVGTSLMAQAALEKIQAVQPDVILLDLDMPEVNGLAAIPLIRKVAPRTKIIILTLLDSATDRAMATLAGADEFVPKSAMFTDLIPIIAKVLSSPQVSKDE